MTPTTYKPIFMIYVVHITNVRTMLLEVKKKSKGGQGRSGKGEYRWNCDLKKNRFKSRGQTFNFPFHFTRNKKHFSVSAKFLATMVHGIIYSSMLLLPIYSSILALWSTSPEFGFRDLSSLDIFAFLILGLIYYKKVGPATTFVNI